MMIGFLDLINQNLNKIFTFKEIKGKSGHKIYKTNCLKNKNHYMYYDKNTNLFTCPICGYKENIVSLSASIKNTTEYEMARRILSRLEIPTDEINNLIQNVEEYKNLLYMINEEALKFFQEEFNKSEKVKNYCKDRGILPETISNFRIGYAPSYNKLYKYLKEKFFEEDLVEVGLIGISEKTNKPYDVFKERLMFPIFDENNNVIAFGGRSLEKKPSSRKYINTKTTPIFSKSHNLYALNTFNKKKKDKILVVEGYMDVIKMHQNGIKNVCGNLGTAITKHHLIILGQYTKNITVMLDGDEAGKNAMDRTLKLVGKVNTLVLENNLDPDEYLETHSAKELLDYIDKNTKSWNDVMLDNYKNQEEEKNIFDYFLRCEEEL